MLWTLFLKYRSAKFFWGQIKIRFAMDCDNCEPWRDDREPRNEITATQWPWTSILNHGCRSCYQEGSVGQGYSNHFKNGSNMGWAPNCGLHQLIRPILNWPNSFPILHSALRMVFKRVIVEEQSSYTRSLTVSPSRLFGNPQIMDQGGLKDPSEADLDIKFEVNLIPLSHSSVVYKFNGLM